MQSSESLKQELESLKCLEDSKATFDTQVQWLNQLARVQKAYYEALKTEGFTPAEALELTGQFHPLRG